MILRAEQISRTYFRKSKSKNIFLAVKETDIGLRKGCLTEVIGRSGSGKSTLLNILAGILTPTSGRVLLDDIDIYALDDRERSRIRSEKIGVIPQGQTGLHSLTVLENVLLPCSMYGMKDKFTDHAEKLLEKVGIDHLKNVYPDELSGGEIRRMAIARAVIRQPEIILADEPTSDLDDENTQNVLKLLREAADNGAAVMLVTHEREAEAYADIVFRMNDGVLSRLRAYP